MPPNKALSIVISWFAQIELFVVFLMFNLEFKTSHFLFV